MPERTPTDTTPETEESVSGSQELLTNEWTLMFYIAGDAMVSATMISQLKELTDAGYQENTTVLAYFDPNCNGRNARIFDVNRQRKDRKTKKTHIGDGKDPYVRTIGEDCYITGLPQIPAALTLRYFLEYARVYYPAKNYMVFLMGHGVVVGNDAFLPDADDDSAITLSDLGRILNRFSEKVRADKSEFHLVGFHSCSMNSVELMYQLAGTARYMLGTQGTAFPGSWPYRQLLKKIFCAINRYKYLATPPTEKYPNELVEEILTGLQDLSFYNSEDFWVAGYSSDLSMCCLDEDKVARLHEPLEKLTSALTAGLMDAAAKECILLAHWESQSYWGETYTDLHDFCGRLQFLCALGSEPQSSIKNACIEVRKVLESDPRMIEGDPAGNFERLIVFSDFYGPSYQFSNGVSIFFPWARPDEKTIGIYDNYAFTRHHKSNSWLSFLETYFRETKRPAEDIKEDPRDPGDGTERSPAKRKTRSLGLLHELGLVNEVDWLEIVPDETLLWLPYLSGNEKAKEMFWAAVGSTKPGLGPPKPPGLGPPKPPGLGPPKPPGLGPPKPPGLGPPKAAGLGPPKAAGLGLFGLTVIKNFDAPEHVFVTSRPFGNPSNRRRRNSKKGPAPNPRRPPER